MKKDIAMKWVEALRSGEYKQGKEMLYNEEMDTYCCLGVLQKINGYECIGYEGDELLTPKQKLDMDLATVSPRVINQDLSTLNDRGYTDPDTMETTGPLTFDEIADLIQIFYKEL